MSSLGSFFRTLCQIAPRKFYPNLECILQEESVHMPLLRPHSECSTQELEAPGFHQKADVLEEIKHVGKLIHRRKVFWGFVLFCF